MKRMRLVTLLLLIVIIAEGLALYRTSRREAELRSALRLYRDHANEAILNTLEEPFQFSSWLGTYTEKTPLEDVLKMIKIRTKNTWLPTGIPIYVDPFGLQAAAREDEVIARALAPIVAGPVGLRESGMGMGSPVGTKPSQEELPLRVHLRNLLKPMGLAYEVQDGLLTITSEESVDKPKGDLSEEALYLRYRNVLK